MLRIIRDLKSALKQMNRLSKAYIRFTGPFVFTSAVLALFCRLAAGFIGVYDNMLFLSGELFELFKNLLSAVFIPAFIVEIVFLLLRYDTIN